MALFCQTPNEVFQEALADLKTVSPEKRPYTRYFQVPKNFSLSILDFNLNSLSFRSTFHYSKQIGNVARIDLQALGWDKHSRFLALERLAKDQNVFFRFSDKYKESLFIDIWEDIARCDPYFQGNRIVNNKLIQGWVDDTEARLLSHSDKFIVRADWFLTKSLVEFQDGGFYSQLLLLPNTKDALFRRLGIDSKFIKGEITAEHGAAVVRSYVAFHNRELIQISSGIGYDWKSLWFTNDFRSDNQNVRVQLANTSLPDGNEYIFTLPNGLHGYFATNGKGTQVNVVPFDIALDRRAKLSDNDPNVRNAIKCFSCHMPENGLIPYVDRAKIMILNDAIEIKKNYAFREKIEEFYTGGFSVQNSRVALDDIFDAQRKSYTSRVSLLTNLTPAKCGTELLTYYDHYFWDLVTSEKAAEEQGLLLQDVRLYWLASADPNLRMLAKNEEIDRRTWERVFKIAQLTIVLDEKLK